MSITDPMPPIVLLRHRLPAVVAVWAIAAAALVPVSAQTPAVTPADLLREARTMRERSPERAIPMAEAVAAAARAAGLADVEGDALALLGDCHAALGRNDRAILSFRQALERERTSDKPRRIAAALVRVSRTLMSRNEYEEAIRGFLEAIKLSEASGDREGAAVATDHLGIAHFVLRNFERAMALCREAEVTLKDAADRAAYAQNQQHIGIIYTGTEQWAEALAQFRSVVVLREQLGNKTELMGALSNVALALRGLKRLEEALAVMDRALAMVPHAENRSVEPLLRLRRGRVYQALGRTSEAAADFERALAVDRTLGNKRRLASTLTSIARFYASTPGREQRAIAALEEAATLNQTVYNEETALRAQELQERFDAERRQKQIELLERDKALAQLESRRQRQIQLAIGVIAVLLTAGLAFAVWRYRVQARIARELGDALQNVNRLQGLLPICAHCKKIRDDDGYWQQVESYIGEHAGTTFSHGICPECLAHHYPEFPAEQPNETPVGRA